MSDEKKTKKKRSNTVKKSNVDGISNENLSFLDKFYNARTDEESWKTGGQNYIWVEDKKDGCIIGEVTSRNSETNEFEVLTQNGETRKIPMDLIFPMNGPDLDFCEDMSNLYHLNNYTLLQNIKERFEKNYIYTFFGNTLLSLNPYQQLPALFSKKQMNLHIGARKDTIEPHIYTVADKAYFDVVKLSINQSVLLFGESSSGKSENMRNFIEYIGNVTGESKKTEMLMNSLIILDAFTNYGTERSPKSSGCLNLVELNFSKSQFTGSTIKPLLINPSRVIDAKNGRNFNIFYQLSTDDKLIDEYGLKDVSDYKILNSLVISGVNDSDSFDDLLDAAESLDLDLEEYFKICVGILKLGNLNFTDEGTMSIDTQQDEIIKIAELLKIDTKEIEKLTVNNISNFIQSLYFHTFNELVSDVNQKLRSTNVVTNYISIIDIPGSQSFDKNQFDQFCINYSNDQIKHENNEIFFKKEQEIYVKERIDWKYIDFGIDSSHIANQTKLIEEIQSESTEIKTVEIQHSNGKVSYEYNNWNKLNQLSYVSDIKSGNKLFNKIFNNMRGQLKLTTEIDKKLSELFRIIESTRFQKVLCLIPNELQKPSIIDSNSILKQIDLHNILQVIKMTRKGYIDHFNHSDFYKRYFMLARKENEKPTDDDYEVAQCKLILKNLNSKQYKVGKELVLLKYSQVFLLEELRAERIIQVIIELQAIARMTLEQKKLNELKEYVLKTPRGPPTIEDSRVPGLLKEIEEITKKYESVVKSTANLTEKYNELKAENSKLLEGHATETKSLNHEISKLTKEKERRNGKLEAKLKEIQYLKEEHEKKIIEIQQDNGKIIQQLHSEIEKLKNTVSDGTPKDNQESIGHNGEVDKIKEEKDKEVQILKEEIQTVEQLLQQEKSSNHELQKKIDSLTEEFNALNSQLNGSRDIQMEISKFEKKLNEEEKKFKKELESKKRLQKELDEKISSLEAIQKERESDKKPNSGLAKSIIVFSLTFVIVAAVSFYAGHKAKDFNINKYL